MEIWVDNEKSWRLTKEYHQQGLNDAEIGKKLYKEHGLVSMRGNKPYTAGAIWAMRNNGKPKRNICKFIRVKPGRVTTTQNKPQQSTTAPKPVDKVSTANERLTVVRQLLEIEELDCETKLQVVMKYLH